MGKSNNCHVAAIVVTYNRLKCLKECLRAIRSQTYKNYDIIIVNNGSTDGTEEFLSSQNDLIVINQTNCGGAGGFYTGMKYMYDNSYDAIWMMDDDGIPDSQQLFYLVRDSIKYDVDFVSALVIDKDNPVMTVKDSLYDKKAYDQKEIIMNLSFAFNGTFIWRDVIEKVGFIKKEMFIWGDESEYLLRVKSKKLKVGTITRAIHYHPSFRVTYEKIVPFVPYGHVRFKPKPKDKIFIRNLGYIDGKYNKGYFIRYFFYYVLRFKFREFSYFMKYYLMGRKDDFSKNLLNEC